MVLGTAALRCAVAEKREPVCSLLWLGAASAARVNGANVASLAVVIAVVAVGASGAAVGSALDASPGNRLLEPLVAGYAR